MKTPAKGTMYRSRFEHDVTSYDFKMSLQIKIGDFVVATGEDDPGPRIGDRFLFVHPKLQTRIWINEYNLARFYDNVKL